MASCPYENEPPACPDHGGSRDAAGPEPGHMVGELAVASMHLDEVADALAGVAVGMNTLARRDPVAKTLSNGLQANLARMSGEFGNLATAVMEFSIRYEDAVLPAEHA